MPEVPHAAVDFTDVHVNENERLPGDGYEQYLKPFRTVEDCHVMGALLGFLLKLARRYSFPQPITQELLLLVAALTTLAAAPPLDSATHIALGGFFDRLERLLNDSAPHFQSVDETTRALWQRDQPLLRVAGKVRAQRLAAAWQRIT